MEEEISLRKIGKMSYETYCLKSLKKMARKCKRRKGGKKK